MTTATTLPPFTHSAPAITATEVQGIATGIGHLAAMFLGLLDVDLSAGRGRISKTCVCVWRHDGHRITVECKEAIIVHASEDPDPDYPGRQQ